MGQEILRIATMLNSRPNFIQYISELSIFSIFFFFCDFEKVLKWFYENYMVLKQEKYCFMWLARNTETARFVFKNKIIKNSEKYNIFGIIINAELTFKNPFTNLWKNASQNIWPLVRLSRYLNETQKSLIFKSVIRYHFSYYPLKILKWHTKKLNIQFGSKISI